MNRNTPRCIRNLQFTVLVLLWLCTACNLDAQQDEAARGVRLLQQQSNDLKRIVNSDIGKTFLQSTKGLPTIETREIFVHKTESQRVLSNSEAKLLDREALAEYSQRKLDEHFYYFTRYGSPLAFVRPLEIAASHDLKTLRGKRIVDFGFGSIGHLRLMASQGADVTGIEVDQRLKALYSLPGDVGQIKPGGDAKTSDTESSGQLELLFGNFPSELGTRLRGDIDWFVSKNTLKRGYIHPEKPVDKRMLIDLGVTDEEFLRSVYRKLKVHGHFLIYNLHPAQAPEGKPYIPWADGRSPFTRAAFEKAGFEVLSFDKNDTAQIHRIAKALNWTEQMDLQKDLFATYTIVRKKK